MYEYKRNNAEKQNTTYCYIFGWKILNFFCQKVDGPGFTLGGTLLGTHKVKKFNLHLT